MADKRIQDLPSASSVQLNDLFVLEQSGAAMNLSGQTLITDLATYLGGHGGIANIVYTAPVSPSLAGTLTITMADNTSYSLSVTNGRGISSISWTSSGTAGDGMTHTGTIAYNDGTTSQVQFQDGLKGDTGPQTYVWFKWANQYPTSDADLQNNVGPYIGICATTASVAPSTYTSYTWYQYKGDKGDTGDSIESIELTNTSNLIDTYTIYLTGHVPVSTFTVTNAKSIVSITQVSGSHAAGTTDTYQILFNDGDTSQFSVYNGANGLGSVSTVSGIQADGNGDVPQVISGNGPPTTATVGQTNQLYYDQTNSVMYWCAGESQGTYVWQGAGVTVDSSLSLSSTNPVQNAVLTAKIGTGTLNTTATNLVGAVNEVLNDIPSPSSTTPIKDGTATAGTESAWARGNHVHPLNVDSTNPSALGTASPGTASTYARRDHVHPMPTIPAASTSTPADLGTADAGTSDAWARGDHVHNMPTYTDVGALSKTTQIWANASPSSAFGAQTITVPNMSGYAFILFTFGSSSEPQSRWSQICPYGISSGAYVSQVNQGTYYRRYATITSATEVYFSDGSGANTLLVPIGIWGVKE